ncbi:hypothetical protein PMI14_01150 [Acidovorax sp. CF316]|uniref:hypothetical protein n=1 Tax=Acidovorax sp. CF316 TaxID=1144317 RepID=UPI00026BD317|nr:hypothetical protein [Acidovorax sp. CF316]EJE53938.1 hypothetical protein PMI14_01150 [Acidovorax sp. CF316]
MSPMACTYLFFRPARLPLSTNGLSPETVLMLRDTDHIKECLAQVAPGLEWVHPTRGQATALGHRVEFHLPEDLSQSPPAMHSSLRIDYTPWVQSLCDRLGWLAFDERPMCLQPHSSAFPA